MRFVADTPDDYKVLSLMQKQITQLFKAEKDTNPDGILCQSYKRIINTSIEKSYEMPGKSTASVNGTMSMQTDDPSLFLAYIVKAATERKKMAIEYRDAKGNVSKRIVEPHSWRNDQVVGWCHERGAWRQFKPSQIVAIALTTQDFDRSEEVLITTADAKAMAHLISG